MFARVYQPVRLVGAVIKHILINLRKLLKRTRRMMTVTSVYTRCLAITGTKSW